MNGRRTNMRGRKLRPKAKKSDESRFDPVIVPGKFPPWDTWNVVSHVAIALHHHAKIKYDCARTCNCANAKIKYDRPRTLLLLYYYAITCHIPPHAATKNNAITLVHMPPIKIMGPNSATESHLSFQSLLVSFFIV